MIELKPGDVFATENPDGFGNIINWYQKITSHDNHARYTHTGIVFSSKGATFEAVKEGVGIYALSHYTGKNILIARPCAKEALVNAILFEMVRQHDGKIYPAWRLALRAIPFLAKYISYHGKYLVCSELVAKFLFLIQVRHGQFLGTDPDTLADEWKLWDNFEVVYEGQLTKEMLG